MLSNRKHQIKKHMKVTTAQNDRIAKMTFSSVYPHYVSKVEKKEELLKSYIKL